MLHPSHSPLFDDPNDICYKALIMNLFIKQYHPLPRSFCARLLARLLTHSLHGAESLFRS